MTKQEFEEKSQGWELYTDGLMNQAQLAKALNVGFDKVTDLRRGGIIRAIKIGSSVRFNYKECLERVKQACVEVS